VYCNLKFDAKFPPPPNFNLFAGGDSDYDKFVAGNYRHIIFNLTLQEGWDDPECYFAYIDKDMGSRDQVSQIVGRVLRQPQAQHYPDNALNTAYFYVRTDEKSVFEDVLHDVQSKISAEAPEISLTVYTGNRGATSKQSARVKRSKQLPEINLDTTHAKKEISRLFESLQDFRKDSVNTVGKGGRVQVLQAVGGPERDLEEWVEVEHSNKVTARWMFVREVQRAYARALHVCDTEIDKLDALIEYNSPAAESIRTFAQKVAKTFIDHSDIVSSFVNPTEVPDVMIDPANARKFKNAVHEFYSGLNNLEVEFAEALDRTQRVWLRNSSKGLFEIPLLSLGRTRTFNPDFLVWVDKQIVAIDTKGEHLIVEDAGRKLFNIRKIGSGADVIVRLVTLGEWNRDIERVDVSGYTVWSIKNGKPYPLHAKHGRQAVEYCLREQ
jgi:type III restriction enzyme